MPYRIIVRINQDNAWTIFVQCLNTVGANKYLIFLTFLIKILFDSHNKKSHCPFLQTGEMEAQRLTQDPKMH